MGFPVMFRSVNSIDDSAILAVCLRTIKSIDLIAKDLFDVCGSQQSAEDMTGGKEKQNRSS